MAHAVRPLQQALETMQLGVTITDTAGTIVFTNAADARMHGYRVDELMGQDVRLFAPGGRAAPMSPEKLKGITSWSREGLNARKDGSVFPVRLLSDVVRDAAGEPVGVITTCEDLTERKRVEEQLRQAQKMEALGQLTGGIAHDFNNLLTIITANVDLVAGSLPLDLTAMRADIAEVQACVRRGSAMVRKLLAFSRQEAVAFHSTNLGELVDEQFVVLRRILPETIHMRVSTADDLPTILADHSAVVQILLNLVTNARDAMPDGGSLEISTDRVRLESAFRDARGWGDAGEYVCLTVRDTGAGMDETTCAKAFEPFFTTKPPGLGTGLGLAMVYGLAKQHGGFVDLQSRLGKGTAVRILFPIHGMQHSAAVESPVEEAPPRGGDETVLIVEDEASIRRAMKRVLERSGYRVLEAIDGGEALAVFASAADDIALVVSDVVMPNMGGRQLYDQLRQAGTRVPFIFVTGYAGRDLADLATLRPPVPCLDKPWTVPDLLRHVRQALDQGPAAATPPRDDGSPGES